MHRDADDDTGFSMAVPGSLTALCLSSCWKRLVWIDVFQRHIEVIVGYGWPPALMCTCASMQKQFPLISRLILKERSTSTSSDLSGGSSDCERQRLQQGPIEQNRLLALEQRDLRRGGATLAPVTTKLSMMDSISLRGDIHSLPGMIPLHHAFGVKGPCQHQVIGLVNDAAAVVHRDGFDDFGFAFGVAFNLDTNWGQDVFGGSRCEPGAGACSASQQLLLEYMFPAFGPEVSNRIALQLKFYQKEVGPVLSVLQAHPCLHFMLPSPCETTQQLANWQLQVQSSWWLLKGGIKVENNPHLTTPTRHVMVGMARSRVIFHCLYTWRNHSM